MKERKNIKAMAMTLLSLCLCMPMKAQLEIDTLKWWQLDNYSEATIANLAADTDNWKPMSKSGTLQRYATLFATDGTPLKANGTVISELDGLTFAAGLEAEQLLLRHNMGASQNGVQVQRVATITLSDLKAGQTVVVYMKSSSKTASGISSVSNLEGECGEGTYPTTSFKEYSFKVVADGQVSFTNTAGVVYRHVGVLDIPEDTRPQLDKPEIKLEGKTVTIIPPVEGASILYSIVDHGKVTDYARTYSAPFTLDRPCTVRAMAQMDGMKDSEESSLYAAIDYEFPFAGKPFVLDPEELNAGLIATETTAGMLVSWRYRLNAPEYKYNLYRNGTKLNDEELTNACTTWLDKDGKTTDKYTLECVNGGITEETAEAMTLPNGYLNIPINRPASGTTSTGEYEYIPGDCMVADVDGDKEYEIIMKWDPSNQMDNSLSGVTGNTIIDGYRMNGEHLWRIDLGKNIRSGAHYTQLMVYDLDGDGKAEVACKTAPGTIDGKGNNVIMEGDDPAADYRTKKGDVDGVVVSGPEYLTVFSGLTGEQLATTAYNPSRNIISGWGDSYGNRSERYLAAVAYLDGEKPSLVMCRGYYTAAYLWAVDFDGKSLKTRWLHTSDVAEYGAYGEGAHSISVADVDGDLKDEIIYGACAIDNDGTLMYRTGWGHGDAMHVGDLVPDRKGLEVMMVHEEPTSKYGVEMHDAMTGELISGYQTGTDVGRGLCADVDPDTRGCEYWSTADNGVYGTDGTKISTKRPSVNFRTYWDGDVQEEVCEEGRIDKWTGKTTNIKNLVNFTTKYGAGTNLIKYTPCLQADIFGDWREEVVYYDNTTKSSLWIFSTPYTTDVAVPTLMHDHHYRMATVWQTSAYNQPPHLSYYLPDYVKYGTLGISETLTSGAEVKAQRFFNLQGQQIAAPEKGIYIIETEYADGRKEAHKVAKAN